MKTQETVVIVKPPPKIEKLKCPDLLSKTKGFIIANDFQISFYAQSKPHLKFWEDFYAVHKGKSYFEAMMKYLMRDFSHFFILRRANAVPTARQLVLDTRIECGLGGKITETGLHATDLEENFPRENELIRDLFFQTC